MPAQKSKLAAALGALVGMIGLSGLAGVLIAALVTPALAVTSMTANSSIGVFDALPDYIRINEQAQANVLYGAYGVDEEGNTNYVPFARIFKQNREEVAWDQVSDYIKDAAVNGEDRRFYEHGGVDIQSIVRAAAGNVTSGDIDSGASTITMQLVKNIKMQEALQIEDEEGRKAALLDAQAQSLERKLKEAKLAIGLEKNYTKDEILLAYLNIVGFGGNTYGIESAAQQYLSKSAKDVTLAEAASLIAIVQLPNTRNLDNPEKYPNNESRRNLILNAMLELGSITQSEYQEAIDTPVESYVNLTRPSSGCMYATYAPTFCDWVLKNVRNYESLGQNPEERIANWNRGGYQVYTTIDLAQQQSAQEQVDWDAPAWEDRFQLGAAVSAVQPRTGRVLVMVQNKAFNDSGEGVDYTETAVNFNTIKAYGASSGFQGGSTYKIFTLATWLKAGHGLSEVVDGSNNKIFKTVPARCTGGWTGNYTGKNFGGGSPGPITVQSATNASVNVAFLSMAQQLDLCDIRDTAAAMGVERADGNELETHLATVLGTNEIAPLSMATAVATISAGGLSCKPIGVDRFVNASGDELRGQSPSCSQALTPDVAAGVAYALQQVMNSGTGTPSNPRNGYPLIGKTGTTDDSIQTWMVGGSTNVALAVWVGNIVGFQNLTRVGLQSGNGGTARHRIFYPTIASLTNWYGGEAFPAPPASLLTGTVEPLPDFYGQSLASTRAALEGLGMIFEDGGSRPHSLPAGTVFATSPEAGTRLSPGFVVTVYTSDGSLAITMPDVIGMGAPAAKSHLESLGFVGGITYQFVESPDTDDPSTFCKVSATDPAPGTAYSIAYAVTLSVTAETAGVEPPCMPGAPPPVPPSP
ncbi:MAG TPA: transglycosylase domain-containing protein [Terrimesophilobacter sp.]|nr:transglycosylase domain-containing protein [Terrimesophilobacter sp.]